MNRNGFLAWSTAIIVSLSLIKIVIFYSIFNVDIEYFINTTDASIIIIKDIVYIIPIAFLLYLFLDQDDLGVDENSPRKHLTDIFNWKTTEYNVKKRIYFYIKKVWELFCLAFMLFVFCVIPIGMIIQKDDFLARIFGYIEILFVVNMALLVFNPKLFVRNFTLKGTIMYAFMIVLCFFLVIRILGETQNVRDGKYLGTKIITNDSTYVSTNEHFYIGQTTSFVFVYNPKTKQPTAISTSKIERIEFSIK